MTIDWSIADVPTNPSVAHPGSDLVAASGTVTFQPGETVQYVPLEILGDTVDEPPLLWGEWGLVGFTNPTTPRSTPAASSGSACSSSSTTTNPEKPR